MDLAQRPPYHSVDFKSLAKTNPDFKQLWQSTSGKLDFQDPETIQALSRAILKSDFDLELQIPNDRLCPPIPNRWNYVSWIQGLIDSTSPSYSNSYEPQRKVIGLDIGTGASAIYTMLCLKSRPNWAMCATDIDKKSFDSAACNLALNSLMTRTKLLQSTSSASLIPLQALALDKLDFTICNPPFFTSETEMNTSLTGNNKTSKPNSICTGASVEMIYPDGGDLGFATKILHESLLLREKVTWYTSMLGKLTSAKQLIMSLKQHGITNWAVGVIDTHAATKRWVVAWSFGDARPANRIARPPTLPNNYLPFPTLYAIPLPPSTSAASASHNLATYFSTLHLTWTWHGASATGVGESAGNVWARAFRRRGKREQCMPDTGDSVKVGEPNSDQVSNLRPTTTATTTTTTTTATATATATAMHRPHQEMETEETQHEKQEVNFVFRVRVVELAREVVVEWVRGRDRVLWESLCGAVHGRVKRAEGD